MQPQERTLSRSISVLAPWKPKLIREGYEIDYNEPDSRSNNPRQSTTLPRSLKNRSSSQSTLTRKTKSRSKNARDEIDSDKSSSFDNSRLSYTNYRGSTSTLPTAGRKARETAAINSRTSTLNSKYRRSWRVSYTVKWGNLGWIFSFEFLSVFIFVRLFANCFFLMP